MIDVDSALPAPWPEWVEPIESKSRKLDVLGLRLSAQTIGNTLLDGITVVTPNPRYLTIATCVARTYAELRRPNDRTQFLAFGENVEAVMALATAMLADGGTGVVGVTEAQKALATAADPVPVPKLVETIGTSLYLGACHSLGLVQDVDDSAVPAITTERGLPLASLQQSLLGQTVLGRALLSGEPILAAPRHQLEELGKATSLTQFDPAERQLLVDAILPDQPRPSERSRVATYGLLLWLAKSGRLTSARLKQAHHELIRCAGGRDESLPDVLRSTADLWLAYCARDALAVVHESVLARITRLLDGQGGSSAIHALLKELLSDTQLLVDGLCAVGLRIDHADFDSIRWRDFEALIDEAIGLRLTAAGIPRWTGRLHEEALIQASLASEVASPALLPVTWAVVSRRLDIATRLDERSMEVIDPPRLAASRIGTRSVIRPMLEQFRSTNPLFRDIVARLAYRTVNQHLRIAWARLSVDPEGRDVAVVTEEGGWWFLRDAFSAGQTDSRLRQVANWLHRLALVDENGLTRSGQVALATCLGLSEDRS